MLKELVTVIKVSLATNHITNAINDTFKLLKVLINKGIHVMDAIEIGTALDNGVELKQNVIPCIIDSINLAN